MSPLSFLFLKKFKNRFKEFVRTPSEIILAAVFAFLLIFSLFTGSMTEVRSEALRSADEFYAIVFALYSVVFVMISKNGFINGASMFSMADVNLIFTSPFKENKVLTYGLIQQMGRSLTLGLFIIFQSTLIKNTYGFGISVIIFALIGYSVTVFLAQMLAMLIYSFTCSDDRKCRIVKTVYYSVIGAFILYLAVSSWNGGIALSAVVSSARTTVMRFFPVSGMVALAVEGAAEGKVQYIISTVIYCAVYCILYFLIVSKTKKDYYEDVLKATEVTFSAITARKEGKAAEAAPRNVKVGKTGLLKGFGASAISEKHKIENRRSKVLIINMTGLVMVGLSALFCLLMRGDTVMIFAMNVYSMTLSVTAGRWAKEFSYPYVYLIPEKPFKKLLYLLVRDIPPMLFESFLCSLPVFFIVRCSIIEALTMTVGRFTFGMMFIGVNLLLQRIFGDSSRKVFTVMIYFLFVLLFSVPAIAVGIYMGMLFPFNYEISFTAMSLICAFIAVILIFTCRNILEYSEYNNK